MTKAEFLAYMQSKIQLGECPKHLVDRVKYLALDYIGLAARGSQFTSSNPIIQFVREFGGNGKGTVIGKKTLQPMKQYAALANGTFSHSLELDDVVNEASLHPAVAVFPSAFAVAEATEASGAAFLEAVIYGYEVMTRLGVALKPAHVYARGYHPTGVCGIFGAVASASKLMNLSHEQTTNAYGIAGSQAAASMEFLQTGAWTKRMHPGWAAHSGLIAAELAKSGFIGPKTVIEGEKGFAHSYSFDYDLSGIEDDFSVEHNAILRTSIKPHACCRYKQGPLDLLLEMMRTEKLQPEDINAVHVYLVKTAFPIVCEPEDQKKNPKSSVDAQFSMPFGAAIAILFQRTLLEQYDEKVVESEEVKAMMQKVFCHHEEAFDKVFPKKWPARVVLETKKGTYERSIDYPKGDPENPLSWEELIVKFRYVTEPVYSKEQQDQIINAVQRIEDYQNMYEFTRLL